MNRLNVSPHASDTWSIEPVGDRCLLVRVGSRVDVKVSHAVHRVVALLEAARLPGVIDVVPAFTSVAVHYRPQDLPAGRVRAFTQLKQRVLAVLREGGEYQQASGRLIEIPACYGGKYGPDLEAVADRCKLTSEEVVRRHASAEQAIYTFFFAPGNPFAGPLDPALSVPRRTTPRTALPAGSVAIANGITCIYDSESPGGWNVIARTPWRLFDLSRPQPMRLQLGDRIRFVPITPDEFDAQWEVRS